MLLRRTALLGACFSIALITESAGAASCLTQAQMAPPQRDALANQARSFIALVQSGDTASLRARLLPAIASDFDGIAASVTTLKPLVQDATITVDNLYLLDASKDQPGAPRTQFFCGSPIVVLTFNGIPPGNYALAILHATGVPKPQQISIILAQSPANQWQLAGFYSKPMIEADHDGIWYWTSARKYTKDHSNLAAWLYYSIADNLLSPVDFLASPNLDKLHQEWQQSRPPNLSPNGSMMVDASGAAFNVINMATSTDFGGLDLVLHYTPDPTQTAQLRTPVTARQQVTQLMTALLAQHPELRQAFHGIWVHADQGQSDLFALELPMNQIATAQPATSSIR